MRPGKRLPGFLQASQAYEPNGRPVVEIGRANFPPLKTDSGFRPSPSSPFRRIEKPAAIVPSAKVPPTYQWTKPNAPPVTNSLREKARMMFDRENVPSQPPPRLKSHQEFYEKPNFLRPAWIEQDKGDSHDTITENGRLDYRSFCKQFAPFVGKASFDSRANRDPEEQRPQREFLGHRQDSCDRNAGVIDGKLSFKMFPDKSAQVQRYPERFAGNERRAGLVHVKSEHPVPVKSDPSPSNARNSLGETTIRGSSSVAIQTGIDDEHLDEGRSFRVAPKISRGSSAVCSNASVQTSSSELEKPAVSVSDAESDRQWKPAYYDRDASRVSNAAYHPDNYRGFVLDHNQNYHLAPGDADYVSADLTSRDNRRITEHNLPEPVHVARYQPTGGSHPIRQQYPEETPGVSEKTRLASEGRSLSPVRGYTGCEGDEEDKTGNYEPEVDWPVENTGFLDDRNIQNQDISPEVGVVTRYTCAIATVASVDSPEPRSEEIGAVDSRTSSSPSPSQFWSWSRPKPVNNEALTAEEEIRRHNLLQQNLVRRLQNERTAFTEQRRSPCRFVETLDQSSCFGQAESYQAASFHETSSSKPTRFLSPDTIKRQEPAPRSTSPIPITANRVGALREAYEQAPISQAKPIQKERSPVPNGVTPIDSSDEYLVSCATKPSRSIVLSKSESWHQLALSNHYPRPPRMNATTGASQPSSLPKPPTKPKASSSQKLRSKQYEASSSADSVKKMESKIRRYFESPVETEAKEPSRSKRSSPRGKGLLGLSRSRTMPGISEERLRLQIPTPQMPLLNVNTADVDKVFDDLFQEATRTEHQ